MAGAQSAPSRPSIARRASIVAAGTLGSRVLGAVRDVVIAASFAVATTDLFWMAFTIPNALRVLLGEGAISGAFVPVLTEVTEKEGEESARHFFARLTGAMSLLLLLVTVVGIVAAEAFVLLYASGFRDDPSRFETTVTLTRIVFPYILFMGCAAMATAALYSRSRFFAPAFAPILLNVALIAAPFALVAPAVALGLPSIAALAIGAVIGGALQLAAQLPSVAKQGLLVLPRIDLRDRHVRKVFRLMGPLLLALGVYQLNVALSRQFASYLPAGALSYLYYGQRLVEIPQGMFAMAIASAALPSLSRTIARGEPEEAKRIFREGLGLALFFAIPSSLGLAVLAEPVVATLFGRGAFGSESIEETGRSLVFQAAGVWAVASVRTVVPMFHALGDTKSPVAASAINLGTFGVAAFLLYRPYEHVGLAAAITLAAIAQLTALLFLLRRRTGRLGLSRLVSSAGRVLLASLAAAAAMGGLAKLGEWSERGGTPLHFALLLACLMVGAFVFLAGAQLLGVPESKVFVETIARRFRRR